jgi:hypothetical protein
MNLLCITLTKSTPGQTQVYSIRIDTKPDRRFHVAIADHTLKGKLAIGTRGDHAELEQALLQAKAYIVDRVQMGWTTLLLAVDPTIEAAFVAARIPTGRGKLPARKFAIGSKQPHGGGTGLLNQVIPAGQILRLFIEPQTTAGTRTIHGADVSDHWIALPLRLQTLCARLPWGSGATVLDGVWTGSAFVATDMPTENDRTLLGLSLEMRLNLLKILIGRFKGIDLAPYAVSRAKKGELSSLVQWDRGEQLWIRENTPSIDSTETVLEVPLRSQDAA